MEPAYQLFDLDRDREERDNIWTQQPVVAGALRQMLEFELAKDRPGATRAVEMDPELVEQLEALGYTE